jgi:hypothetical protein
MPYVEQYKRGFVSDILKLFEKKFPHIENGDLNYLITQFCNIYLKEKGECYKTYNELIGVLECAKLEYYRRKTGPYEDKVIKKNGDL